MAAVAELGSLGVIARVKPIIQIKDGLLGNLATIVFLLALTALASCTTSADWSKNFVTTYYDRNHDGIVDFELHHLPGGRDTDWALTDTHFRGRYDLKIVWGFGLTKESVDIPVPKGVPIAEGQPPVTQTE